MKTTFAIAALISWIAPSLVASHGIEGLSEYGKLIKRENVAAASKCAASNVFGSAVAEARMRKMKLKKRWDPSYSTLQNTTCVLNPEVTEGPYWIAGELVRQNITDEEPGVPFLLDLGVMDVTTCTPISGAYVEIWHCNTTGYYSGYTNALSSTATTSSGHAALTDSLNFFRGAQKTNANGLVEFSSKFPGWYTSRTTHIHLKVTLNPTENANGTITGGQTVHVGQIFLDTATKNAVFQLEPYASAHKDSEITNEDDSIFQEESANGNNPIISLVSLGSAVSDGFLGYITIGVNPSNTVTSSIAAPLLGDEISTSSSSSSSSSSGSSSGGSGGSPPSGAPTGGFPTFTRTVTTTVTTTATA